MTNQHFVQQNLAEYLPEPSHPQYDAFVSNFDNYKTELETRYPQVCPNCAPRVNERLKAGAQAARADHLRRVLATKKPLLTRPRWQDWGVKRVLVFVAGLAWWGSVLGQSIWHLLAVLPPAEKQLQLRTASWYGQWSCAASALLSRNLQHSCLHASIDSAWWALYLGIASIWWNNQLSKKLNSRERTLSGIGQYLLMQIISLATRAAALFVLANPAWLPASMPPTGIHIAMLVFIPNITLLSMTTVKLTALRRPNLTNHHPVPVDPLAAKTAYQTHALPSMSQTTSFATSFPISALSQAPELDLLTPPDTQTSKFEDEDNAMDWTPTGPSQYTQFNHQPKAEYQRPAGPNPFRGTLPPAPKAPAHKIRNPKPFLPASQDKKSNFMKEIRGELRAVTSTPSDDEDETFGFGGRKKSKTGFVLNPSNMRDYQAEGAASGLEDLFNSAFTIKEPTAAVRSTKQATKETLEQERGFLTDGDTVRENVMMARALLGLSALLVLCFAIAVGMGWLNPKTALESVLYEKETVREVHEVIEDFVQDYIGT